MSELTLRHQLYNDDFYNRNKNNSVRSAAEILPILFREIYRPKSVCDFGCGAGGFLMVAKGLGVEHILGIDGPYVAQADRLIDDNEFIGHDLQVSLPSLNRKFDLAISLEVAEHLTDTRADPLVEMLTRTAPVVLFSAAIPGQGGIHHINERWPRYWIEKFERQGFVAFDCLRPRIWRNREVAWWYAQNMFLFVSSDALTLVRGIESDMRTSKSPLLSLIHPARFLAKPGNY